MHVLDSYTEVLHPHKHLHSHCSFHEHTETHLKQEISGEDICGLFFFLRVSVAFNSYKDLEHDKIIT